AAGFVDLEASSDLTFLGKIKANGTTRDTDGGTITFGAPGNMTVAGGGLDASGGDRGSGGFIDIEVVNGSLVVSAPLDVRGGEGGDVLFVGGTTWQPPAAADINVSGTGDAGSGGSIDLSANGDLSIAGSATGTGAVSADPTFPDGGDGADYCLTSIIGSITVTGQANMSAASGGGGGGLDFEAGLDLTISVPMATMSTGADGFAGDVTFLAPRVLTLSQSVNAQGGTGIGGSIDAEAGTSADVSNQLMVDSTQVAGNIFLSGCTVNIESNGLLSSTGPVAATPGAGVNMVQAGSTMTIPGTVKARAQNSLTYRHPPAPVTTGATITPPPTTQQDSNTPCCVDCPVTTTTTTTLPTTTTTSSTSTTTTGPPTTTTTSSTSTTTT